MKHTRFPSRPGFTLVELLVVIAIIGVLAGLLLPAIQQAREAARRTDCSNKIRNLALAAQQFEGANRRYPVSVRVPSTATPARPRIAGITQLLPNLEQNILYNAYQVDRDWNDNRDSQTMPVARTGPLNQDFPSNRQLAEQRLPILLCPSSTNPERLDGDPEVKSAPYANAAWTESVAVTDYSAVLGASPRLVLAIGAAQSPSTTTPAGVRAGNGILSSARPGRSSDVKDGLSNTIMYAESAGRPEVYRNGRKVGELNQFRLNGGGWARPGSDFYIDGAKITNPQTKTAGFPGTANGAAGINVTNGEDIQSSTFTVATGFAKANPSTINMIAADPGSTAWYDAVSTTTPAQTGFYGTGEIYSFHSGGANIAFGDGGVRFVNQGIDLENLARLATREGAEIVDPKAFD